jgi:broad specificity phosphatase PhoE
LVNALLAQSEDCIIFSHFVAINAAVGAATNDDRMRIFAPDNCSVTTLDNADGQLAAIDLGITADTHIN